MADPEVSVSSWLRKQVERVDTDLIREVLESVAEYPMGLEADELCGAARRQKSQERVDHRNGYRSRRRDTRTGGIELAIPRLRRGSYFPEWLLTPRKRAEKALVQVVCEGCINGVSTRRMDRLAAAIGMEGISESQVSEMAKGIDRPVDDFRQRPLDGGPCPHVRMDALGQRCREGSRVVNVAAVVATGVDAQGRRRIPGLEVFASDDEKVPESARDFVATLHRSIFSRQTPDQVRDQHRRVVE